MERVSAWINSAISAAGGDWKLYLALIIALVILLLIAAGLWLRPLFSGNSREKQAVTAKQFEEYCRMYEAGRRDADDEGFRRHVEDRRKHEEFLKEFLRRHGDQRISRNL